MPVYYEKKDLFDSYLKKLKKEKETFQVHQTTYTSKVKLSTHTMLFNEEGKADNRTLYLINNVRSDAKKYLKEYPKSIRKTDIKYFDLLPRPFSTKVIIKADVKAAYWTYALKRGIISYETNEKFKKYFAEDDYDTAKDARLKALGSLATTKRIRYFEKGKELYDPKNKPITEPTKSLYLEICRGIDDLMTLCCKQVEGCIYYYWDCIFATSEFSDDVVEFFKKYGYDVTTEETRLSVFKVNNDLYYLETTDGKQYCTRWEDKHLLMD